MRDYEQEYNDLMFELFEAHDAYRDLLGSMTFDAERVQAVGDRVGEARVALDRFVEGLAK